MHYYNSKILIKPFDKVVEMVTEALKQEGFGVLTEINVSEVFRKKLNIDFPKYKILGACNPKFAHEALLQENKIGTMLPCNVVVREQLDSSIEVAVVDPSASMSVVENEELGKLAHTVKLKLQNVLERLV